MKAQVLAVLIAASMAILVPGHASGASHPMGTEVGGAPQPKVQTGNNSAVTFPPLRVAPDAVMPIPIRDQSGRTLVLRGINLGKKSPPYVPDVTEEDFAQIASWGFNTVRFLILWAAIEPEEGVYDDAYFDRVRPYLDMAQAQDLHVILDMHQDVYGEMFGFDGAPAWACPEDLVAGFEPYPEWWMNYFTKEVMACFSWFWHDETIQDHFVEAWQRAVLSLGDHPAVIGFDLYNEPYPGFNWSPNFEPALLQPLYERLIMILQSAAPDAYFFVEPWVLRDYFISTYLEPMPFERLVYFPHYYNIPMELNSSYPGTGLTVRDWVTSVAEEAVDLGMSMAVGEYGGNTQAQGIEGLLEDVNEALEGYNTGGMYWEYGRGDGGFVILNADGSEKSAIMQAVVRSYPRRVAGELLSTDFEPGTANLAIRYVRDASIETPTEISAPSRLYPAGFSVYLSDPDTMTWTYDGDRGALTIYDDGPDGLERSVDLVTR